MKMDVKKTAELKKRGITEMSSAPPVQSGAEDEGSVINTRPANRPPQLWKMRNRPVSGLMSEAWLRVNCLPMPVAQWHNNSP